MLPAEMVPAPMRIPHFIGSPNAGMGGGAPPLLPRAAAISAALADLREIARRHLETFLERIDGLPDRCRGAFLPVSLCEPYMREMEKPSYNPFETAVTLPQWRRQWSLWRAAKRWG